MSNPSVLLRRRRALKRDQAALKQLSSTAKIYGHFVDVANDGAVIDAPAC